MSSRRARENADLIRRMKAGESLSLVAPQATWWPPRPVIKKDADEVARALGLEAPRLISLSGTSSSIGQLADQIDP